MCTTNKINVLEYIFVFEAEKNRDTVNKNEGNG